MRTLKALVLPVATLILFSCADSGQTHIAKHLGEGPRGLHRLVEYENQEGTLSGGFFLFVGGMSGKMKTSTKVKFSWQLADGTYAIGSLPIEQIRVRLDEKVVNPTIEFHGRTPSGCNRRPSSKTQETLNKNVAYALVTVRESDWTPRIRMPLSE